MYLLTLERRSRKERRNVPFPVTFHVYPDLCTHLPFHKKKTSAASAVIVPSVSSTHRQLPASQAKVRATKKKTDDPTMMAAVVSAGTAAIYSEYEAIVLLVIDS